MTKYLSHYHLCLTVKKYLLTEIQDKYGLRFCGLHTSTAFCQQYTYDYDILYNISAEYRLC
jgi:hypothetical protein